MRRAVYQAYSKVGGEQSLSINQIGIPTVRTRAGARHGGKILQSYLGILDLLGCSLNGTSWFR